MPDAPQILEYFSGPSRPQARAATALQVWAILCWVGTPLGFWIGGIGVAVAIMLLIPNVDDRPEGWEQWLLCFLWCVNALGFLIWPVWGLLCWTWRTRILRGDITGVLYATRMCYIALAGGSVFVLSLLFGPVFALLHRHPIEILAYLATILIVGVWAAFVVHTLRLLHAAALPPPSPTTHQ